MAEGYLRRNATLSDDEAHMLRIDWAVRMTLCSVVLPGASTLKAAEPLQVTVTDVEKNIYVESLNLTSDQVTPDCPYAWSVRKYVLHGGRQEGVEVIDVDNGRLRFRVVPTRGMTIQEVRMDDLRLGWDSPVKDLVHPKLVNLESRQGLGWLEGFNGWLVRCGLEFFGAPGTDEFIDNTGNKAKMDLTLHGKIANIPASVVEVVVGRSEPFEIRVRGKMDETCMHGPKLELWTEVSTRAGSDAFSRVRQYHQSQRQAAGVRRLVPRELRPTPDGGERPVHCAGQTRRPHQCPRRLGCVHL